MVVVYVLEIILGSDSENTGNSGSDINAKPISTNDFIKSININDKAKSQIQVLTKNLNFIHNLVWNNLNKILVN